MSDYERRRMLLQQVSGRGSYSVPQYEQKVQGAEKSTLGLRVMICVICFIGYLMCDYGKVTFGEVDSKAVSAEIGKQTTIQDVWNDMK